MKLSTLTVVFVILAVSVIGCERMHEVIQHTSETSDKEIVVGVVLSQTGILGKTEFGPGASVMQNAFELALENINQSHLLGDIDLKFIVKDDMSTTEGAINAFNQLIHQERVPVIIGVWTSHLAKSVLPIAQENGVVAFSPVITAPGLTEIGNLIFRTTLTSEVLITAGIKATHERLGYRRPVTISDTVDYASQLSRDAYEQTLSDYGISVLASETFKTGDTDFSDQLSRIKKLNPDVIFVSAQDIELIQILNQARQIGIPSEVPLVTLILSKDLIKSAGNAAEGVIVFSSWIHTLDTDSNQEFIRNYESKYGTFPSSWAAQSYATVHILAEAIRTAQAADSESIATALLQVNEFPTILGDVSFDSHGNAVYDPVILIVRDSKLEIFD